MASTPDPRRLIINADDYGISRGVNIGIIEAARAGAVTSASAIVNLPAFDDAVARARSAPSLSLGLHLNLTSGRPLSAVPSLTRSNGDFYALPMLAIRASLGLVAAPDVMRESLAQMDRMIGAGLQPTHLDSHRHVHAHPAIFATVVAAAASRGISRVRIPREPMRVNAVDWRAALKKAGLLGCTYLAGRGADGGDSFFGISLQGGRSFAARLFALIPRLPPGLSELMVHPGYSDVSLAEWDNYTRGREAELSVLCSRQFRELLDSCAVTLTSFGDLRRVVPHESKLRHHH